jgi:rubrerythrin
MNLEQAIQQAIEYEIRVRNAYREALAAASDEGGRKLFALMAEEEQRHVEFLEARRTDAVTKGHLSVDDLATALPNADTIRAAVNKMTNHLSSADKGKSLELLESARALELETSAFYRKMVGELGPDGRAFFARFLEIEEGHVALVDAEIQAVRGMGFWFDVAEFSLENA